MARLEYIVLYLLGMLPFCTMFEIRMGALAGKMSQPSETYLDEAKTVHLTWMFNETHIDLQATVKTLGWFTIGISPDGGMDKSDVMLAWVNDTTGEAFVQDRWLTANATTHKVDLTLDTQQNWVLLGGVQTATDTTVRATRPLITCDNLTDRPFSTNSLRIIYSFHAQDPPAVGRVPYHGRKNRGGKTMLMFSPTFQRAPLARDNATKEISVKMDQVMIANSTEHLLQCKLIPLPPFDGTLHIINTLAVIQSGNEKIVQRIIVTFCDEQIAPDLPGKDFNCADKINTQTMATVKQHCKAIIAAWGIGGGSFIYPDDVGLPLTSSTTGGRFVLMQVHYDNPLKLDVNDSSGITFQLTDKLRKNEAAFLTTGVLQMDYALTIPPQSAEFVITSYCMDYCTQSSLPTSGITVFAAFLNAEEQGRKMSVRHVRNGKELTLIAMDDNLDASYQEARRPTALATIFPGDRLIIECRYSTANKKAPTFGDQESCLAFLSYYPPTNMTTCGSMINTKRFLEATGYIPALSAQNSVTVDEDFRQDVENSSLVREYYSTKYSWNAENSAKLQKFYQDEDQLGVCLGKNVDIMKQSHFASFIPSLRSADTCFDSSAKRASRIIGQTVIESASPKALTPVATQKSIVVSPQSTVTVVPIPAANVLLTVAPKAVATVNKLSPALFIFAICCIIHKLFPI